MDIKTLNNREDKLIKRYQKAYFKSMLKAIKQKGVSKSALAQHRKSMKLISKEMTKSGLGLGLQWLNSSLQNSDQE